VAERSSLERSGARITAGRQGDGGSPASQVANERRDFHHKTAKALVADHDVIVIEDLKIANMVRRARPLSDPDIPGAFLATGAAATTGLNESISDASSTQFSSILRPKRKKLWRR